MKIAIIDYGVGNLFSLKSAFETLGEEIIVSADASEILAADAVVLPGVGAFGDAAEALRACGMDEVVREVAALGTPLLGICLGMQLLFDESLEFGRHEGLGLIPGRVVPMRGMVADELKIPQIGWNALEATANPTAILRDTKPGDYVYFVHSYCAVDCDDYITAIVDYGAPITACVERGNVYGCQFHPEKSGDVGLRILKTFCDDAQTRAGKLGKGGEATC